MKALIKVYVGPDVKAKLEDRAGRESLSSFVSGLIDNYFEEYPGLSHAEVSKMEALMPKAGDTVTIKKPARFKPTALAFNKEEFAEDDPLKVTIGGEEVVFCEHGATAFNCKKWGCKFYEIPNGRR